MKQILIFCTAFTAMLPFSFDRDEDEYTPIETVFPLQWKANIGAASYRTNIILDGNQLIMGSNGRSFRDFNLLDSKGGVYSLNRKTGTSIQQFASEVPGDMDVNGVLLYNGLLYFGNDNEEMFCTDKNGKEIWRKPVSGDIEHQPVLLQIGKQKAVVFATERGEIQAVDPANGNVIWVHYTPEFKGWKPGKNRAIMKVQSFVSNTESFLTRPLVAHVNNNGSEDLVYKTYDGRVYAVDGNTGKRIVSYPTGIWTLCEVIDVVKRPKGNHIRFLVLRGSYPHFKLCLTELNTKGEVTREVVVSEDCGTVANAIKTPSGDIVIPAKDFLHIVAANDSISHIDLKIELSEEVSKEIWYKSRSSYSPWIADKVFSFKGIKQCVMILHQQDHLVNGKGFIEIVDLDARSVVTRLQLPGEGELAPVIGDITGDGKRDLLFSSYNGNLYCYSFKP